MTEADILAKIEQAGVFDQPEAFEILKRVHSVFPLPGSGMSATFKGTHSLTLVNGQVCLNLWVDDHCWQITP